MNFNCFTDVGIKTAASLYALQDEAISVVDLFEDTPQDRRR